MRQPPAAACMPALPMDGTCFRHRPRGGSSPCRWVPRLPPCPALPCPGDTWEPTGVHVATDGHPECRGSGEHVGPRCSRFCSNFEIHSVIKVEQQV